MRSSHAVVLDAAWARDGNFVAMLTAHGTVHLHEVSSRPQERPKRRRKSTITAPTTDKADATVGMSAGMSPPSSNGFLGGIKSGWQTMSTQVNAMRSNTGNDSRSTFGIPKTFAGFREATNAGAAAGGRAIARGLSQGYSAARIGAADVWHADDNKIKHKDLPNNIPARSVRWLRSRTGIAIAVACGGKVHLYPIQRVTRQRGESTFSGLKAESKGRREFGLPPITTTAGPASQSSSSSRANPCARQGPHGFWGLRGGGAAAAATTTHSTHAPPAPDSDKALYETNPPYCPLYIDRRVSMLGYADPDPDFQARGHGFADAPWLFGGPLPAATKLNDRSGVSEASLSDDEDGEDGLDGGVGGNPLLEDGGPRAREDEGVQSRIMINPANNEIRIGSSRRKGRKGKGVRRAEEGEFELLEGEGEGEGEGEEGMF